MKGRCIIIPGVLNQQVLDQLHLNHMGIEKRKLLAHANPVYWVDINTDIDKAYKNCNMCLEFRADAAQGEDGTP